MEDATATGTAEACVRELGAARRKRQRAAALLLALAAIVAAGVFWQLHSTGIALSNEALCGMEEHQHTEACYDADGALACGLEEHAHTAECYADGAAEAAAAQTYEAEGEGYSVTVTAPAGALPEGAVLTVELLDSEGDEYAEAAEAVGYDASDETAGMAALDISFEVDGEEVEPAEAVTVSIDASALLPDDADASTLEVCHLAETDAGVQPELVADAAGTSAGTVDAETAVAEFEVEGFSTFTIQWSANQYDSTAITTTCYFSSDGTSYTTNDALVPAGVDDNQLWVGYDNEVDFDDSNSLLAVDGYTLDHAVLYIPSDTNGNYTSVTITSIRAITSWSTSWTYEYLASGSAEWTTFTVSRTSQGGPGTTHTTYTAYLQLYYVQTEPELTGDLAIVDDIANTGSLVASYSGNETLADGSYSYQWYKLNEGTGEYELIEGENEASLAVYADGARETYQVKLVWVANGTEIATSNTYQVPYYDQLQNGSFENPSVSGSAQLTDGLYSELVWHTTGFGSLNTSKGTDGQDIEIVNALEKGSSYFESDTAEGEQYAELNCETAGTLYQDVMTIPGVPLYWQASHEARTNSDTDRTGLDTMCVIIVDAEFAEAHLTTQAQIDAVYEAAVTAGLNTNLADGESSSVTFNYTVDGDTKSITLWLCASNGWNEETDSTNDAWNEFTGTYQVPEEQYLTRFLFGSISTCSGYNTVGNLLDNVSFSQSAPISKKYGNITITKTVTGVDSEDVIAKGAYTFEVKDGSGNTVGTVSLPTADAKVGESEYWSYTITGITPATYYVVESNYDFSPDGYNHQSTTSSTSSNVSSNETSANFVVTQSQTSTVAFTNVYTKTTTSVTLKKVDSKTNSDGNYTPLSGAVFTLSGSDETYTTGTDGTIKIENLAYGTEYTLTETTAPDGYNLLTDSIVFTINTDGKVTFISGDDNGNIATYNTDTSGAITITVKNEAGYVLPSTGGSGTVPYALAGLALCGATGALLLSRRKVRA